MRTTEIVAKIPANNVMADTAGEEAESRTVDPLLAEIHKRIEDAFDVFDHEMNKTVDVRFAAMQHVGPMVMVLL